MTMEAPSAQLLAEIMGYDHPKLVRRLQEKLRIQKREEALDLFDDTKRFFFLCGTVPHSLAPPERIDECWRQFILYTQDYAEFCQSFFGRFIQHRPKGPDEVTESDRRIIDMTLVAAHEVFGERLSGNWTFRRRKGVADPCEKCEGSTNCQEPKCKD